MTALLFLIARNVSAHNELPYPEENSVTSVMKVDADQHRTSRVKRGVCGGDMHAARGVITSPSFPEKYRDNTLCRWNISVAETEQIEVSYRSLGLETCTNCSCDYVKTYSRYTDNLIIFNGPFCGTSPPNAYTSYENHLVLEFKTDSGVQGPGFSAVYTKKPCGGVFSDMKGTVRSPRHPQYYPRNKRCTYEIVAAPRHCIILSFTRFDLKYKSDCSDDSLHVYSTEFTGTVKNYGRSCGSRAPSNIACEGTKVRMELKSGSHGEHTGFLLDYQQVYTECAVNNGGCKHICKPNIPGNHTCTCRTGYLLHPDDRDCKPENLEGKIVQLTSATQQNTLLVFSWKWRDGVVPSKLSGYYFKAVSSGHTFQTTLPATLCNYTAHELYLYTEYEVTLWPYYGKKGQSCERLGKPISLSVRTPASAPSAPTAVKPWRQPSSHLVSLAIFGPKVWNSKPDSFRVQLKPTDADEAMVRIVKLTASMASALRSTNYVNITLLVKPGRTYNASVSACGVGDLKETLVGPETAFTFITTPLAPVLLSTNIIDPNSAVVSWRSPSPSERYEVTLTFQNTGRREDPKDTFSHLSRRQSPSSMVLWRKTRDNRNASVWVDGSHMTLSSHSLPVCELLPCGTYAVHIRTCLADACSDATTTVFKTSPSSIPTPFITTIFSNDTSSIHVEWSFRRPIERPDLDPQFEVRVGTNGIFEVIKTTGMALTVTNLSDGTEYEVEVRQSLKVAPELRKYSNPARAVVRTWPKVPLAPTLSTKGFENAPDVVSVSWVFVNSSITDVEVGVNSSEFVSCKTMPDCDIDVLHGSNSSFKAGFVQLSGLRPYETYNIVLRGSNDHGCGDATNVILTTSISVPSEPLNLHVSTVDNVTADLDWEPPEEPAGPLTGYLVSWECDTGRPMAATTTEGFFAVPGLTTTPQNCSFSVSAYNVDDDGEQLYGKSATLTAEWPLRPTTSPDLFSGLNIV
ncbi:uncharacterized protein LOC144138731 [Haemaphysalis longicornis]